MIFSVLLLLLSSFAIIFAIQWVRTFLPRPEKWSRMKEAESASALILDAPVRGDCEPHRATLLIPLAAFSLIFGFCSPCFPLFGLFGLIVGEVCHAMAARDLAQMTAGERDPHGWTATQLAAQQSRQAVAFSMPWLIVWGVIVAVALCQFLVR